jgi:hypothetical protein
MIVCSPTCHTTSTQASASGREALEEQADMLSKALDSSRDRIQGLQVSKL